MVDKVRKSLIHSFKFFLNYTFAHNIWKYENIGEQ